MFTEDPPGFVEQPRHLLIARRHVEVRLTSGAGSLPRLRPGRSAQVVAVGGELAGNPLTTALQMKRPIPDVDLLRAPVEFVGCVRGAGIVSGAGDSKVAAGLVVVPRDVV
jgi:hypothetical protein